MDSLGQRSDELMEFFGQFTGPKAAEAFWTGLRHHPRATPKRQARTRAPIAPSPDPAKRRRKGHAKNSWRTAASFSARYFSIDGGFGFAVKIGPASATSSGSSRAVVPFRCSSRRTLGTLTHPPQNFPKMSGVVPNASLAFDQIRYIRRSPLAVSVSQNDWIAL